MKKAIFKGFAVAALALAVLFTGCNNGQSNIEEVKVDAVEITAKAYPGYNYVTWGKAADANGSTITVYRDDGKLCTPNATAALAYVDTDIKDGVTYKYTAYVSNGKTVATPYTNTNINLGDTEAKNGYVKIDAVSSDSCKAINPICIKDGKLMTALELCDFEDKGDEDFVINPENIVLELNDNGTYDVAFPTKQYLSYETKVYHGNAYELFGRNKVATSDVTTKSQAVAKEFYTNDSAVRYNAPVSAAGEYTVEVKVSAINSAYTPSYVKAAKTFTIEALDVATATGTPAAGYVKDNKTIRVVWTPAKKADKSDWAVENYKVYVKDSNAVYTEIAPAKAVTVDEEGNKTEGAAKLTIDAGAKKGDVVYYIDYPVENNKVAYNFTVVLADNGKVESTAKTASVDPYALGTLTWDSTNKQIKNGNTSLATLSTTFYDVEKNGNADDAILTFNAIDKNLVINSVKYVAIKGNDVAQYKYEDLLLDSEFATAATLPADYTKKDFVVSNVAAANKVVFLVSANYTSATKEYKDLLFTIATGAQEPSATISASEYSVVESANSTAAAPKYNVTLIPGTYDNKELYTYTASYAMLDANTASAAKVTEWKPISITIAKDGSTWKGSAEVALTPTTTYSKDVDGKVTVVRDTFVFKIEKTLKAAASDPNAKAVAYQTVIVTATK